MDLETSINGQMMAVSKTNEQALESSIEKSLIGVLL